jgi:hypothetical protein
MKYIIAIMALLASGCVATDKRKSDVADIQPTTKTVRITLIRIDNLTIKAF